MRGEYLQDYVTLLPQSDRVEVEKLITANEELFEIQVVNEEQFQQLIQVLAKGIKQVAKLVEQGDRLDAVILNEFYSAVALDLQNLYRQHLTTETVVANYDRILQGVLEDMKRELGNLRQRVQELDMRAKGEDGLLVKSYGFEEDDRGTFMETDRQQYGHLFTDRDGSVIEDAVLERQYHQHYLVLPRQNVVDCLRDASGRITASIEITDRRGVAVSSPSHGIDRAIDDSGDTYWAEVVTTDSPIETRMKKIKGAGE